MISNWAGTRWDPARKAERYRSGEVFGRQPAVTQPEPDEQETIQGTITWDEESEDGLPKIVTAEGKECRWAELGKELMIHEGRRVRIELGEASTRETARLLFSRNGACAGQAPRASLWILGLKARRLMRT